MNRGSTLGATSALLFWLAGPALAQYGKPAEAAPPPDAPVERFRHARIGTSVEEWARALESRDSDRRLEVMDDLGRSTDSRAETYLLKAVDDPDARIQAKAIDYLGDRRAPDATSVLVRKLFMTGAPTGLRQHILSALGKIGDPKASRPIFDFVTHERSADVRGTGVYALGEIGDLAIREELEGYADDEPDPRVKHLVHEALVKIVRLPRPKEQVFVPPPDSIIPRLNPPERPQ